MVSSPAQTPVMRETVTMMPSQETIILSSTPSNRTFRDSNGTTRTTNMIRKWPIVVDTLTALTAIIVLWSTIIVQLSSLSPHGGVCCALAPTSVIGRTKSPASTSPLFSRRNNNNLQSRLSSSSSSATKSNRHPFWSVRSMRTTSSSSSFSSSTALHVLTTPESIIEQASTVNLLDDLIDESVRTSARRPIMMQFDPSSGWIWRRWTGTIFAETWPACVRNMLYAVAIYFIQQSYPSINRNLSGFGTLWGQILSITTFTLTFFVNQSYSLWRKCMELSRRLQGRLHDIGLNMATHATRKVPTNPTEKATYTASSRQILELMSRYVRLFNLLTYASFTRSHRPILTPRGMRRLVERGLMTATEREVLVDAAIPATQRHSVVLMWMIRLFVEGRASGHIQGGAGFEAETMNKFHIIRSQYGAIGDELQGRMPLAYAHIVQVLVDLILWMFPIMALSTGMSPLLVILGTGLLTISYQGLFDLAKQFLDPYDNENYGRGDDPLCVDTLIAETNAGSVRWMYGFEEMPFSSQRVVDGEMYDYLLPVRGYSVAELVQMEEEKKERERLALEEQQKREEEEAAAAAAAERLRKELEEAATVVEEKADNDDPLRVGDFIETKESSNTAKPGGDIVNGGDETLVRKDDVSAVVVDSLQDVSSSDASVMPPQATDEGKQKVHKVQTLATGKPVSTTKEKPSTQKKPVVEEAVPSNVQTTNYLATLTKKQSSSSQKKKLKKSSSSSSSTAGGSEKNSARKVLGDAPPSLDATDRENQEIVRSQQQVVDGVVGGGTSTIDDVGMSGTNDTAVPEISGSVGLNDFSNDKKNADQVLNEKDSAEGSSSKGTAEIEGGKAQPPTLTLEEYNSQVEKILTLVEEELRETEAILKSKPGADPVGWDYDREKLVPRTETPAALDDEEPHLKDEVEMQLNENVDVEAMDDDDEVLDVDEIVSDVDDDDEANGGIIEAEVHETDVDAADTKEDQEQEQQEQLLVDDINGIENINESGATFTIDDEILLQDDKATSESAEAKIQ